MFLYRTKLLCLSFLFSLLVMQSAMATHIPLTMTPDTTVGGTLVFKADLTGLGISQVGSITIVDDGTTIGGAPGIFSGFDLDAIFLDDDGNLATTGDRHFASNYIFSAGTTRATSNSAYLPNASHPGPTFGSIDANTIDLATATLETLDGISIADVNLADGFLTLGDGGSLIANFAPEIMVGSTLFLMTGEVGGQPGEGLSASVFVAENRIPEPATLGLIGLGLLGLTFKRR